MRAAAVRIHRPSPSGFGGTGDTVKRGVGPEGSAEPELALVVEASPAGESVDETEEAGGFMLSGPARTFLGDVE